MAKISISDLQPAGSGLFEDSESLIDSVRDLSENELKTTLGGTLRLFKFKRKLKSKSKKRKVGRKGKSISSSFKHC